MNTFAFTWQAGVAGRWTARILGTLMVLFLLAFVVGEGIPHFARMNTRDLFIAIGLGCLFLGLIVAWFWEGWGGLLSVLGWVLLAVVARKPPLDLVLAIPAAVGVLHLLCWWRLRSPAPVPGFSLHYGHSLWAPLAVFVLLCANEIFGNPPLMVRIGQPPPEMTGTWHANPLEIPVVFTIAPDGSVSGTVGEAEVTSGRFECNRSWFGRLMHWRTDYVIRGTLSRTVESYGGTSGDRFSAPVNRRGLELGGSLFLSHPGAPRPLRLRLEKQ